MIDIIPIEKNGRVLPKLIFTCVKCGEIGDKIKVCGLGRDEICDKCGHIEEVRWGPEVWEENKY